MQFTNLFNSDDRAVSPVIGVILMVAITVILAAVIGTFVLGLGDSVSDTSPQASISFSYADDGDGTSTLSITHEGGDPIPDDATVTFSDSSMVLENSPFSSAFTVGQSRDIEIDSTLSQGDKVSIVVGDRIVASYTHQ